MTAGAFGIVIANARGTDERVTLEDYAGLARRSRCWRGCSPSSCCRWRAFPSRPGSWASSTSCGRWCRAGLPPLAVILVLASLVSYFYYLRVIVVMYMRPARSADEHARRGSPGPAMAGVAAAAVLVVLLFFTAGIRWGRDRDPSARGDSRWSVFRVAEQGRGVAVRRGAQALQGQPPPAAEPARTAVAGCRRPAEGAGAGGWTEGRPGATTPGLAVCTGIARSGFTGPPRTAKGLTGMADRDEGPKDEEKAKKPLVTPRRAAAGLGAAAAAAYAVYVLGARRTRRSPVTELPNALELPMQYQKWGDVHYAYYQPRGHGAAGRLSALHQRRGQSAHEMRPLVRAFRKHTERPLYALEWLGFGHSDRPELAYDPGLMEDQLQHFLERVVRPAGGADVVGCRWARRTRPRWRGAGRTWCTPLAAIEPAGLGKDPPAIPRLWSRLLFTLPGVQRAFYDRLTTPEALYEFAAENLFTPEFGVPEEFVEFGAETSRMDGASFPAGRLSERPDVSRATRRTPSGACGSRCWWCTARWRAGGRRATTAFRSWTAGPTCRWWGCPRAACRTGSAPQEVWERVRDFLEGGAPRA